MARTNTLSNFLTDVANAIRTKKGTETTIAASAFDTEILNLPSGTYQTKNITISANGSQTITPDQGYDAIDEITITTQVPQKQLQSKTYNFNTNQTVELTPDTGYDGFDVVTLTINVPGQQINNQDKTITQNGTYTADSGYTGLGTVTVNVPSSTSDANITAQDVIKDKIAYGANGRIVGTLKGARYYATEQEMYADTEVDAHTYGLIYRYIFNDLAVGAIFDRLVFPDEVTLTEAITSSGGGQIMWDKVSGPEDWPMTDARYDTTSFRFMCYANTFSFDVEYTSEDGIHYTRNSSSPSSYQFEQTWKMVDDFESILPVAGKFLQVQSYYQGGFYEFLVETDEHARLPLDVVNSQLSETPFYMPSELINRDDGGHIGYAIIKTYHYDTLKKMNVVDTADLVYGIYQNSMSSDGNIVSIIGDSSMANPNIYHYDFSLDNPLVSTDYVSTSPFYTFDMTDYTYVFGSRSGTTWAKITYNGTQYNQVPQLYPHWSKARNQYTLTNSNQILPGVIAYGKEDIITGSNEIYHNLDHNLVNTMTLNDDTDITLETCISSGGKTPYCGMIVNDDIDDTFDTMLYKTVSSVNRDIGSSSRQPTINDCIVSIEDDYLIGYTYYSSDGLYIWHWKLSTGELLGKATSNLKYNSRYSAPIKVGNKVYFNGWYSGNTIEITVYDMSTKTSSTYSVAGRSYFNSKGGLITGVSSNAVYVGTWDGIYRCTNGSFNSWTKVLSTSNQQSSNYLFDMVNAKSTKYAFTHNGNGQSDTLYLYNMTDSSTLTINLAWESTRYRSWIAVTTFDIGTDTYIYVYSDTTDDSKRFYKIDASKNITTWNPGTISNYITGPTPKYSATDDSIWFKSGNAIIRYFPNTDTAKHYGINCTDIDISNIPSTITVMQMDSSAFKTTATRTGTATKLFEGDYLFYNNKCRTRDLNNIFGISN